MCIARIERLHADQRGTISIVSVFALLLLTILLGMVMNVGRAVDSKVRMQNAADASAYSGGVVIARGMNTLAFTNHLLADVFALTAFMREARDRNAESLVPPILAGWAAEGPTFATSNFPKFQRLGAAIVQKVPLEQQLVGAFSQWAAAASQRILPTLEAILAAEMIPEYQRAVVLVYPDIAQRAAMDIARRNGQPERGRGELLGVLWRSSGVPVGGGYELVDRTLPVVDPVRDAVPNQAQYVSLARSQRRRLAERYLRDWNNEALVMFDHYAKMSQFGALWRSFTCGQLEKLLEEEYPLRNLPHLIRTRPSEIADTNAHLQDHFTFLGVVYWKSYVPSLPALFRDPMDSDPLAYAEVQVFVPRSRLVWHHAAPGGGSSRVSLGGVPGDFAQLPVDNPTPGTPDGEGGRWFVGRQGVPMHWDLLNQNWTCQLRPVTQPALATILQTMPPVPELAGRDLRLPRLGSLSSMDLQRISPH